MDSSVTQPALLLDVHEQPGLFVLTPITATPPSTSVETEAGVTVYAHPRPPCDTATLVPATVSVALRGEEFGPFGAIV